MECACVVLTVDGESGLRARGTKRTIVIPTAIFSTL